MDLVKGKNIIITGASRGIGRGIAMAFAKQGANVAFTYSSSEGPAKELEAELSAFGITAKAFKSTLLTLMLHNNLLPMYWKYSIL